MSEQHKALLTRANAAMSAGDYEGFLAHCTDDTDWTFVGEQRLRGKDAVRAYIKRTYLTPPTFDVRELLAADDFVTALGTITLPNAAGKPTTYEYCDVWRIRDGKLAELRAYVVEVKEDGEA